MTARHKLNSANIIGCLLLAAVARGVTGSWMVFFVAGVVLVALAISDGGIRLSSRR